MWLSMQGSPTLLELLESTTVLIDTTSEDKLIPLVCLEAIVL
jgi:hypothetical protein